MIRPQDCLTNLATFAAGLALVFASCLAPVAAADESGSTPDVSTDPQQLTEVPPASPALSCSLRALRVMAPGVNGARVMCEISGAPDADELFVVHDSRMPPDRSVCSGALQSGTGTCSGALIDRSELGLDSLSLTATSMPSGTPLGSFSLAPPPADGEAKAPPGMQYQPQPLP